MSQEILITLEAARVNTGLTIAEAAPLFGIHRDTLWKYEQDSTNVPRTFMIRAEEVYGIPAKHLFFGKKSDFHRIRKEGA
ncbi:helix-turn-helix transcriptional regulator [Thermobacillus sp.]|uniref:helix-turn-helix domain-containing protein n=1 Tax=Thermobacillus sp. TaxID=2108467 RepID=UPI00257A7D5D|nr:helix-turn-helix transcriptional regulator [Thermobacillus sp.]